MYGRCIQITDVHYPVSGRHVEKLNFYIFPLSKLFFIGRGETDNGVSLHEHK